jgi:hypothetical protein
VDPTAVTPLAKNAQEQPKETMPAISKTAATPASGPKPFDLNDIDPARLYLNANLLDKGFEFKRHEPGTRPRWTLRKTDEDREYTAVFLLGADSRTSAITLEIVGADAKLPDLARSYFTSILSAMLPKDMADEVFGWLKMQSSSAASEYSTYHVDFFFC